MKSWMLILFVICATVTAMVTRDRRALPSDEQDASEGVKTVKEAPVQVCARKTPCAWSMYNENSNKAINFVIKNRYCECGNGTSCDVDEDDTSVNAFIHHCLTEKKNSDS